MIAAINDKPVRSQAELLQQGRNGSTATHATLRVIRNRRGRDIRIEIQAGVGLVVGAGLQTTDTAHHDAWELLRAEIGQLQQRLQHLEAQVDAQARR